MFGIFSQCEQIMQCYEGEVYVKDEKNHMEYRGRNKQGDVSHLNFFSVCFLCNSILLQFPSLVSDGALMISY